MRSSSAAVVWHHKAVTRIVSAPSRVVLLLVLLPGMLYGQSHHRSAPSAKPAATPSDPAAQQLASLMISQQHALQTGDPSTIAEATRPLIADLLRQMAKLRLLQGNASGAVDLYRKSLDFQNSTEARLELASALLRTGKPQDAANETATVLQTDPRSASAWAIQGSALRSAGNNKGAADSFNHSLEITPDANVAFALGSALLASHEKEKADRIFRQIITASGNAAIWHVAAGDAYREALYLSDAAEEFKKAIAIDPRVGHAEFFLGLTSLQMNEWGPNSQSFEHLRAAVRLAPHEYLSNFYLGALESTDGSDLASSNRHLHAAAKADPSSPEVWLYLGLNAAREKNTSAAKQYLRKAIELTGPDEARNNFQIRRVYAVLGRILLSEGDRVEGAALLTKFKQTEQLSIGKSAHAIAQAATDDRRSTLSDISADVAYPGMKSTDTIAAPEYAAAAGTTNSTHPQPEVTPQVAAQQQLGGLLASSFNDLGTAEARQGKYELALEYFHEAERWQPPTPPMLHNIATAAFRVGAFSESVRALELYLKAGPSEVRDSSQDDRSRMMLAMSFFSLGKFAEADKNFASIPNLALQDPRAAYSWAYSLAHSGQQQQANQIADRLTKQELAPDVLSLVCHLYMDTESYDQSIACFRKAYQANPNLRLAHYQVAESLIRLDRPAEAVPELKQELTLTPDNPDVQYSLAFAFLQTSHKSEAMAILQDLTTSHPTHAQAQYQLGKALLEQGDTVQATKHLELAEQNDPQPDYIHYQLQTAYRKAGRVEDADRELKIYRDIKSRNREIAPTHK